MSDAAKVSALDEAHPIDGPKVRQCLRCATDFTSQWSGERVCSRCKSSNTWRSGLPLKSSVSNGKR